MYQRWCIYIDILGFSKVWECDEYKALKSLGELMRAIYRIGKKVYPNEVERFFVHQTGDGFAIVSDFGEDTLERPINENSQGTQLLSINWVLARMQTLSDIQAQACLVSPESKELVQKIIEYCTYYSSSRTLLTRNQGCS